VRLVERTDLRASALGTRAARLCSRHRRQLEVLCRVRRVVHDIFTYGPALVKVPWRLRSPIDARGGMGNSRRDPTIAAQADAILACIRALRRDLLRNPTEEAQGAGLTGPQVMVMASLVGGGPTTLTELSRTLGMSHSTASGIVDRLQSQALVRRIPDAVDHRRTRIHVTEKVNRYVQELQEGPSGRLARALESATPAQRRTIRKGLGLLRDLLRHR